MISSASSAGGYSDNTRIVSVFVKNVLRCCKFELIPDLIGILEAQVVEMVDMSMDIPALEITLGSLVGGLLASKNLEWNVVQEWIERVEETIGGDWTPKRKGFSVSDVPILAKFQASILGSIVSSRSDSILELASQILGQNLEKEEDLDVEVFKKYWWGTNAELLTMIPDVSVLRLLDTFGVLSALSPNLSSIITLHNLLNTENGKITEENIGKVAEIIKSSKINAGYVKSLVGFFARSCQFHSSNTQPPELKKWLETMNSGLELQGNTNLQCEILYTFQHLGTHGEFKSIGIFIFFISQL
jgi:hypothetical protein